MPGINENRIDIRDLGLHPEELKKAMTEATRKNFAGLPYSERINNYDFGLHPEDAQKTEKAKDDPVNHPSHYTSYKGLEVIQLTEQMNFNKGNAVKYISRAGLKDPDTEVQDLEKAKWYIQREIDRISIAPTAAQEILDANIRAFKDLSEEN